jgi:hypothetical protein
MAAPPKPTFVVCDEFSVTVQCFDEANTPDESATYRLEHKQYPQEWGEAKSMPVAPNGSEPVTVQCIDLQPCVAICVKM